MGRRFTMALAIALAALAGPGCVVTDKIEFEDAVNRPPRIISYTPQGLIVSAYPDGDQSFSAVVQDPDEDDPLRTDMEARLFASNAYFGEKAFPCDPPRRPPTLVAVQAGSAEGAFIYITCTLRSWNLADIPPGVETEVTLEVSDLGYGADNEPDPDAHTVSVRWVLEVEQ